MTDVPAIHRLGPSEIHHMRALNALFGCAFDDPETYTAQPPTDDYLELLLDREHVIILIASINGEVVGGLVAYELEKFEQARREVYIYDLAVAEPHQRQGIATTLIERLRDIAAKRGVWVIYVQADYTDPPAVALYEKLGVREDVMHFDIAVSNASG